MAKVLLSTWTARKSFLLGSVMLTCVIILSLPFYQRQQQFRADEFSPQTEVDQEKKRITEELAEITRGYTDGLNSSSVGLISAKTRGEDVKWILDYCKEHENVTPFIYSTDESPEEDLIRPSLSRGREVAAYLSYVTDYYDRLPAYSLFIHSNGDQWHNDILGPRTSTVLQNLRLEAVDAQGYVNMRCSHNPGCPTHVHPHNPTEIDIQNKDVRAYFTEIYRDLFAVPLEDVPEHIGAICCAQFAVSRERIRRRPKSDYERMTRWANTTEITGSFGVGWVFETLWHVVFGMDAIHCPRYEQCRCDNFGWCGPLATGEILTPVSNSR